MQEHARHSGEWGGQGRPLAVYKARRAFSSHSVLEVLGLDTAIELSQKLKHGTKESLDHTTKGGAQVRIPGQNRQGR